MPRKPANRGKFDLPKHIKATPLTFPDDKRLRGSIKGIKTTLHRAGFQDVAQLIEETHDGLLPDRMEALEQHILSEMRGYLDDPNDAKLSHIFHTVQLWGGKTGRYIYTKSGGFRLNYNGSAYAHFARWAADCSAIPTEQRVAELRGASDSIRYCGVAFGTKHARFWAQASGAPPLPIYDRLLSQGAFGFDVPHWSHYTAYVQEMVNHAEQLGINVYQLERLAFVFFSSAEGRVWISERLRSK
jgi:hypothetical protein